MDSSVLAIDDCVRETTFEKSKLLQLRQSQNEDHILSFVNRNITLSAHEISEKSQNIRNMLH